MALPIINASDFKGSIRISSTASKDVRLEDYVNEFYAPFVSFAIGDEALQIIEEQNTLTKKWQDLFDGVFYENIQYKKTKKTLGLKWAVLRYIYYKFINDNFLSTGIGKVSSKSEVSQVLANVETSQLVAVRYNQSIEEINCALTDWILNYRDFKGTIDSFIDNGSGNYTINSSNTIYLENGDTVTINLIDYEVSNVQDDVSFDISGEENLSFEGNYIYSPFESVCLSRKGYMVA